MGGRCKIDRRCRLVCVTPSPLYLSSTPSDRFKFTKSFAVQLNGCRDHRLEVGPVSFDLTALYEECGEI